MKLKRNTPNKILSWIKDFQIKPLNVYDTTLGEVLLQRGMISRSQLENAYKTHKDAIQQSGKSVRFDQTLVEMGFISSNDLLQVIEKDDRLFDNLSSNHFPAGVKEAGIPSRLPYKLKRRLKISSDEDEMDIPLGQMLIKNGLISEKQLQRALSVQRDTSRRIGRNVRIGQILVELDFISSNDLIRAFKKDDRLLKRFPSNITKPSLINKQKAIASKLSGPRIPLWLKMFAALSTIIVITIFPISYINLTRQQTQLYQQTMAFGTVSLNYIASSARIPLVENNILRLNALIKDAAAIKEVDYALIIDHQNIIKAHTDLNQIGKAYYKPSNVEQVTRKGDTTYFDHILPSGSRMLNMTRPITFTGKRLGEAHVGISIDFIEDLIKKERSSVIIITSLLLFGSIIITLFYGIRFTRPISQLVLATQMIGNGDYRYKVNLSQKDELGTLATAFNRMSDDLYTKSLVQQAFGKYVGANVLDMIMTKPESTWLDGNKAVATILFVDIRGFTSHFETREPEEIIKELNKYFELATNSIREFDGYIDKFMGDAVLGIFGLSKNKNRHREKAVRAAIHMRDAFAKEGKKGSRLFTAIGIGINTGTVFSGSVGSDVRMEYTVIGDSVNVASRLSDIAGPGDIIISKPVYDNLDGIIEAQALPPQKIKGKLKPIEVYKVMGIK